MVFKSIEGRIWSGFVEGYYERVEEFLIKIGFRV